MYLWFLVVLSVGDTHDSLMADMSSLFKNKGVYKYTYHFMPINSFPIYIVTSYVRKLVDTTGYNRIATESRRKFNGKLRNTKYAGAR